MSRLITIISILVAVIIISITGIFYTDNMRDELSEISENALKNCSEKDSHQLMENVNRLSSLWESRQPVLSLYVRHDELESVSNHLVGLFAHAKNNDFDNASVELYKFKFMLNHIYNREVPSIDTLF